MRPRARRARAAGSARAIAARRASSSLLRLLDGYGVAGRRDLTSHAPHRDEEQDAGEARRQGQRRGLPPPRAPPTARLELLPQLGAIARPIHRRRFGDGARELAEQLTELIGVLPAIRALVEVARDALALGGWKLAA